ncbi:MAG: sulfate adenylyltransferase [Deltaproteobacteria bacterium]|nr:sulfate adenylyltransferase [Deltaproteobacteria bacterium]MBW1935680.1 sulfate adenylyltransferase [Deltaproteobacteria bacterium]MBW1977947.1 sulfate adenylyltransferase [Deltaproteobacteria bacterium]MBW2044030.1 sulfate adenylyltransferase [Deltaproteobacteria bacterium]MBW2301048.1 sulfate adenylyltransferase [Deltaproteobacteria bacterium]
MSDLIAPHGKEEKLMPLLVEGQELEKEIERAKTLKHITMTTRETSDCIMMGIGAFTPLTGFMTKADWKGVCDEFVMTDGTFWPIPITLSTDDESVKVGDDIALDDPETGATIATMQVTEKYTIEKEYECAAIFKTTDLEHPGVEKVMSQGQYNLAGPVKVLSESYYPQQFKGLYQRPAESRKMFQELGWKRIAALQLRNPMHRSHEYLAKIAIEVMDGVYIHQLLGKLKTGDIPADVRTKAIQVLVDNYFVKGTVVQGGYPMEMRYAGPREALLHAVFRQNYGCTHMIVGRDHAGVGDYYGPFDAQKIFDDIPKAALKCQNLNIDWTFWCYRCGGMASMKTCPHGKKDRLLLSGTMVRKILSEGGELPVEFSRPEVVKVLQDYYQNLEEKVEIKLHGAATGEVKKP